MPGGERRARFSARAVARRRLSLHAPAAAAAAAAAGGCLAAPFGISAGTAGNVSAVFCGGGITGPGAACFGAAGAGALMSISAGGPTCLVSPGALSAGTVSGAAMPGTAAGALEARRGRGRGLLGRRAVEPDIDRDAAVFVETAHLGLAVEHEIDRDRIVVGVGVDRFQRRRQSRHRIGQIPFDLPVEIEHEPAVALLGNDIDALGQIEHVAHEGRLAGDPHADGGRLALLVGGALAMQLAFGLARAAGEVVDHLLRRAGHHADPGLRQQVDEQPIGRGYGVDLHFVGERDADDGAVGIETRGADVAAGAAEAGDIDGHRLLEAHHQDRKFDVDARRHFPVEAESETRKAAVGVDIDLALDRFGGARAAAERQAQREQQHGFQHEQDRRHPPHEPPARPRVLGAHLLQAEGRSGH